MRVVIQRVRSSKVTVDDKVIGEIDKGLMVLVGISREDSTKDCDYIIDKLINLRIFTDSDDKMNLSAKDINAEVLVVSQFTLYGDVRHGRRPSFTQSASSEDGKVLYDYFCDRISTQGLKVAFGEYGADMLVDIQNDGPVTILLDSQKLF